jgi:hypothetical protein
MITLLIIDNKIKNIHIPLWAVTAVGVPTFMPTLEGSALKETPGCTALNDTLEGGALN